MTLVVSIARDEPLCIKAIADAAAAWGRHDKGFGYCDRGTIDCGGGQIFEIILNVAVRPNGKSAEFANFPLNLEASGELTDDAATVGVFAVKHGKATVAIVVPSLLDELEANPDQAIELDRVVLAKGAEAHLRMIVSVKACTAAAATSGESIVDDRSDDAPLLIQADIAVAVLGTSRVSESPAETARPTSQPFVEQTSTAIIFGHGAVVRLVEVVAAGQILILRHGVSNEEAACRVVSVNGKPGAKSFVELEFLQPAPGFWGDALPSPAGANTPGVAATQPPSVIENAKSAPDRKHSPARQIPAPIAPPPEITKSSRVSTARHVFSKLLEVPAAISEALLGETPKPADAEARPAPSASVNAAPTEAPAVSQEPHPVPQSMAPNPAPVADEPGKILAAPAPVLAERAAVAVSTSPIISEPLPTLAELFPPVAGPAQLADAMDAIAPTAAEISPAIAEPTPPAAEAAPRAAEVAQSVSTLEVEAPEEAQLPSTPASEPIPGDPFLAENAKPIANKSEPVVARPVRAEKPPAAADAASVTAPIAPVRPVASVISRGVALSGDKAFVWNKQNEPKQSRAGSFAVAAAVLLALAAGIGFYVWQHENRQDTNVAAATQPNSSAPAPAAPADAPDPAATAHGSAPPASATPSTAPAAASTTRTANDAAVGQPNANPGSSAAKPGSASVPDASAQFARGPEVSEMRMSTPSAATRRTTAATPAMTRDDMPSGTEGAATGAITPDTESSGPAAPPAVQTSTGAQQPQLLFAPAPVYPYAARAEHIQGDVSVDLTISDDGKVTSWAVLSGPTLLRAAAVDALRRRRYVPATLDGKLIATHVVVIVHFQL